jgi:tellurite resistance-related uncharacterized protein
MDWPSTLVPYHRSDTFTEETVPDGLLREHDTKEGAWALIRVLEGELGFIDLDAGREMTLGPKSPGFIEPKQRHRIELRGPVKFYVEFFRDASAEEE